jgi:all-trans-8'-apo-beta-carotenal 15,15'-oxygenase
MIAVCLIWFSFLVWTPLHGFPLGGVPKSAAGFHSFSSNAAPQEQSMPDMAAYSRGFQTVFTEQPCHRIDATIPSDLQPGTYYRCGPSMFSAGSILPPKTFLIQPKAPVVPDGSDRDRMVLHPWEGDGGILAISILENNQQIVTRFRYVRTNAFTNERKQGLRLYTGMDATRRMAKQDLIQPAWKHHLQPGLNKMRKNTSHTRAVHWGQRLLSLWEGGLPYKLDAVALDTEGRSQLGGVLKETDSLGGSAVYDANSNRMLFTTNQQDVTTSKLTIYEFNDKFRLQQKHEAELKGFALLSDFAVTKNYILVVQPPVSVNAMQFLFNKEPGKVLQLQTGASVSTRNVIVLNVHVKVGNSHQQWATHIPLLHAINRPCCSFHATDPHKNPWSCRLRESRSGTCKSSMPLKTRTVPLSLTPSEWTIEA